MYYPKSQIKTNLYTNGKEFYLSTTRESYKGYYHIVSGNLFYTGKNPSDIPVILLLTDIPAPPSDTDGVFPPNEIIIQDKSYESIDTGNIRNNQIYSITPKSTPLQSRFLPSFNSPLPTPRNYKEGEFQRYFCKKNNEIIYFEINQKTFQSLKNQEANIAYDLYTPLSIPWSLTGDKEQVFNTNKRIATLKETRGKFYGFVAYFKNNWLEFYQSPIKENLYTNGGEYKLKNNTEYIGDYHIHPEKGPMVGATHIDTPHDYLYPITQNTGSIEQPQSTSIIGGGGY